MFNKCYGRKNEAERCEHIKDCTLATAPVNVGSDVVYSIGFYPDAFCRCKRDEESPRKVTIQQLTEVYNLTKGKKKLQFTLEEAIEKYRDYGLLKE